MRNNVTISGISGDKHGEKCKDTVIQFLSDKVGLTALASEILVAHRVGKMGDKPRLMIIRCIPELKTRILQNAHNLKGKKNELGDFFYVSKQLPEQLSELERENRAIVKKNQIIRG